MDTYRFENSRKKILSSPSSSGIGTLNEKSVHAVLKDYYGVFDDNKEVPLGSFEADIVGERGVIEIQTRSLWRLADKLKALLSACDVTVVFPLEAKKDILWTDPESGEVVTVGRSTRKMTAEWGIAELYDIRGSLGNERLHLRFPVLEVQEIRLLNGWSKDKKKGSQKCDKIPLKLLDELIIENTADASQYTTLLRSELPDSFTVDEISKLYRLDKKRSGRFISVMKLVGAVQCVGKKGRKNLYERL